MGALPSRSVEIRISNKTWNITLRNPSSYCYYGRCTHSFLPEMSPGSSGICHFSHDSKDSCGVAGILVYEAEFFTLAILFSNPINYKRFSMLLGLELSPGKAHLGRLEDIYTRMANGIYSSSLPDIKFSRVVMGKNHGTAQVSHGPITVTATMSKASNSFLEVVLEEEGLGKEAGILNPDREKSEKFVFKTHY